MTRLMALMNDRLAEYEDDQQAQFMFRMAREDGVTLAQFIKGSIDAMLPYMNTPGSDHYVI